MERKLKNLRWSARDIALAKTVLEQLEEDGSLARTDLISSLFDGSSKAIKARKLVWQNKLLPQLEQLQYVKMFCFDGDKHVKWTAGHKIYVVKKKTYSFFTFFLCAKMFDSEIFFCR